MKSIQESTIIELLLQHQKKLHFPLGILGSGEPQDFMLIADAGEAPLLWIEEVGASDLAFPVIDPYVICPQYSPSFAVKDLEALELKSVDDLLVLALVSMVHQKDQNMTANLAAPLLINIRQGLARQGVIGNRDEFPTNYPLSTIEKSKL